jgi:hypothetical protein
VKFFAAIAIAAMLFLLMLKQQEQQVRVLREAVPKN